MAIQNIIAFIVFWGIIFLMVYLYKRTKEKRNYYDISKAKQKPNTQSRSKTHSVTDCSQWQCPKCGVALEKGWLGKVVFPGEDASVMHGSATCEGCGALFQQSDIYSGMYDIAPAKVKEPKSKHRCSQCGRTLYKASDFNLSDTTSRIAATKAGLGFKCKGCGILYCFDCIATALQHASTGGRACNKCGSAMDMLK